MPTPRLSMEVLLRIIEFCDQETMKTLCEISVFRALLNNFQTSIVKNIRREFNGVAPDDGHSPFLIAHDLRALEWFKSLDVEPGTPIFVEGKPKLVQMNSFIALEELQKRRHEIEVLLRSPYFRIQPGPCCDPHSWPAFPHADAKANLSFLLERAITRCDVLADMQGRAVVDVGQPSAWHRYFPVDSLAARLKWFCPFTQDAVKRFLVPERTLNLQVEYLQGLPLDSLVELYFLGTYLAVCRQSSSARILDMDFEDFVDEHLFQEAMLRHGTWFIFGHIRGYGARSLHMKLLLHQVRQELVLVPTEADGKYVCHLNGLRMTLDCMLRERLGITKQGELRTEVYKRVGAKIGAPAAFDNPPFLSDRPLSCAQVSPWWI